MARLLIFGLFIGSIAANTAYASPLEKARKRLAQTNLTDASLVAYDSCEKGVTETCLQAAIMFCLDKQENIAKDTLERLEPDFDRAYYTPEIELLTKALKEKGAICGATTQKLAMITGDLSVIAGLILNRVLKGERLNDEDAVLMKRICDDDIAKQLGDQILLAAKNEDITKLMQFGISCKAPGTLVVQGVPAGYRILVSPLKAEGKAKSPRGRTLTLASERLIPGDYRVTVTGLDVTFPTMTCTIRPGSTTKLELPAAVRIKSQIRPKTVSLNGEPIKRSKSRSFNFIRSKKLAVMITTAIHKPYKTEMLLDAGEIRVVKITEDDLVLRDDVAAYRANNIQRWVSYGSMGVGGLLVVLSVVSFVDGVGKADDAATAFSQYESSTGLDEANRLQAQTETSDDEAASAKTMGLIYAVAGIGAAGFGAYWLYKHPSLPTPKGVTRTGPSLMPYATANATGMVFSTSW